MALRIAKVHATSWKTAYRGIFRDHYLDNEVDQDRQEKWRRRMPELLAGTGEIFLATMAGEDAGFLCVEIGPEREWGAFVDNLHVLPAYQGANIGGALLACGADWARRHGEKQLYLWVYELNEQARRFYRRDGWQEKERISFDVPGGGERFVLRLIKPI